MMFIRNDLPQRRRYDIESHAINNANGRIELLAVQVTIKQEAWFLICIYKQPKANITTLLTVLTILCMTAP